MPGDLLSGMRGGMVFDFAAYFYHAGSDYEYGNANDHSLFSDSFPVVPGDRGEPGLDEICGTVLFYSWGFHFIQRHVEAWGTGVDAAPYVKLPLLFQESDESYTGRIPDSVFRLYLYRDVFRRMGPDFAGCRILFRAEGGDTAESL